MTTGRIRPFWDFVEGVPLSSSSGGFQVSLDKLIGGLRSAHVGSSPAQVSISQSQSSSLLDDTADVWFTDPPYDDQIPYADLSDFFFVWMKRALPGHPMLRDPY